MYCRPESGSNTTIVASGRQVSGDLQRREHRGAARAADQDPFRRVMARAVRNESRSRDPDVLDQPPTGRTCEGKKSSPIPSTR